LFTVVVATVALFARAEVMTGIGCTLNDPNTPEVEKGECYAFSLGYTIVVQEAGVMDGAWEKWHYVLTKEKKVNINHLNVGP